MCGLNSSWASRQDFSFFLKAELGLEGLPRTASNLDSASCKHSHWLAMSCKVLGLRECSLQSQSSVALRNSCSHQNLWSSLTRILLKSASGFMERSRALICKRSGPHGLVCSVLFGNLLAVCTGHIYICKSSHFCLWGKWVIFFFPFFTISYFFTDNITQILPELVLVMKGHNDMICLCNNQDLFSGTRRGEGQVQTRTCNWITPDGLSAQD